MIRKHRPPKPRAFSRHRSLEHERTAHESSYREKAFADAWEIENEPNAGLNFGLGTLYDLVGVSTLDADGKPLLWPRSYRRTKFYPLRTRDCQVAATVVQWFGTHCGWCFLEAALDRCGYRIVKK
jgi:hypothetical protein